MKALRRLRRWGGEKLVRGMVQLFLDQAPQRIADARTAIDKDEASEVERAMHGLRSSCASVGALTMQGLSAEAEQLAAGRNLTSIPRLLATLEGEYRRYVAWLPPALDDLEEAE